VTLSPSDVSILASAEARSVFFPAGLTRLAHDSQYADNELPRSVRYHLHL